MAGDEAALGELYDELSPLVYGLAARVTRDWAAAEDITQEVFVHVWEDPQAFDPARGTWRGWLGTMTHRRAVDWVRRSAVRHRRTADAAPPVAAPDPEETAVAGSVAKSVQAAVDDLPAAQREAIRLAYFDGQTYRQVALIVRFGVRLLPAALRLAGADRPPRSARLVLEGPAGGDWTIAPAGQDAGTPRAPDATITMDAVEFCYLLGNRRDPDSVPHLVEGDPAVAATLLRAATTLGCD